MSDRLTPQQRHLNMAAIHSKNTKPEIVVRRFLWSNGFRYRLNHPRLPGKPDIVLRKYRTCIFVNGCFWHGHHIALAGAQMPVANSACCKLPKTNRDFWVRKIQRNQARDHSVQQQLALMGWHSVTVWECQLKPRQREQTLRSLVHTLNCIFLEDHAIHHYSFSEEDLALVAESTPCDYNRN